MSLPVQTWVYLALYIVTLSAHLFVAGSVVVGSLMAGGVACWPGSSSAAKDIAACLRSWLPFMLGVAVTIGVAPLLFVQVLYQESFYSASLLMSLRFFALVPLLMLGFYLLYLGKGSFVRVKAPQAGAALLVASACFVFIASTWAGTHLLSLRPERWPAVYVQGAPLMQASSGARLLVFAGLALVSIATLLRYLLDTHVRVYAALAGLGVLVGAFAAFAWYRDMGQLPPHSSLAAYASVLLSALLSLSWLASTRWPLQARWRHLSALLTAMLLTAVLIVRECQRLAHVDLRSLQGLHGFSAASWLFAIFFILNSVLIALCVRWVRAATRGQ